MAANIAEPLHPQFYVLAKEAVVRHTRHQAGHGYEAEAELGRCIAQSGEGRFGKGLLGSLVCAGRGSRWSGAGVRLYRNAT